MPIEVADLKICQKVTREGGSNLSLISKGLSKPRQNLFAPCYASMRLVDDMVDERFLSLNDVDRKGEKDSYLDRLSAWEEMSVNATEGIYEHSRYNFKLPENVAGAVFRGLSQTLGRSDLGSEPWTTMATAMRRDVEEKPILTWHDFEEYGWGATVSPTAVFLYILTCKYDGKADLYTGRNGCDLMTQARSIGLFCYLVHIARDLVKDAQKNKQLLTVPQEILKETSRSDSLLSKDEVTFVTREVLVKAKSYIADLEIQRDDLLTQMNLPNQLIFKSLLGLYMGMYEKLCKNPLAAMTSNFESELRGNSREFTTISGE